MAIIKKSTLTALGDRSGLTYVSWDVCSLTGQTVYTYQRQPGREHKFEVYNFHAEDLTLENMARMVELKVTRAAPL